MDSYPVYGTLLLNPTDHAWQIERSFATYLKPGVRGVWFPGRTTPSIVPGALYHSREEDGRLTLVEVTAEALRAVKGDIFDVHGNVVIPDRLRGKMVDEPTLPIMGLSMVRSAVDNRISELSRNWTRRHPPGLLEEWSRFIRPEFLTTPHTDDELVTKFNEEREDLIAAMRNCLSEICTQVQEFIGTSERDKWTMHFLRVVGTDLIVEKSDDFRVWDWTRRTNLGEWV